MSLLSLHCRHHHRHHHRGVCVKLHLRDGRPSLRRSSTRTKGRTDRRKDARPQRTNDVHRDRRRHAVSTSLRLVDRVKTQTDGWMNGQTPGIDFGAF